MRLWSVFRVSVREQLRSPWDLLLTLVLIPGMLLLYWSFMGGGSTSYAVLVIDQDTGPVAAVSGAREAMGRMAQVSYQNGDPLLRIVTVSDRAGAERRLRDREAAALVIFPPGFTAAVRSRSASAGGVANVTLVGDLNNPYYSVAAILSTAAIDAYVRAASGQVSPVAIVEQPLGGSGSRSEFESYVPGLLVAAGALMLYSVAIAIARQIEAGTVRRLRITRMTAFDLLGGIALLYILVALLSIVVAFLVAGALGFRSQGPLWLGLVICALSSLSVIGAGLLTACFSRTTAKAAIVANFPLLVLLFLSGAVFPMPRADLFSLAGHLVQPYDLVPLTHAVAALNKVLTLGAGVREVAFELGALGFLSVVYLGAGMWLFQRLHLRTVR
jgi:ABC-2 type transport system permease protein